MGRGHEKARRLQGLAVCSKAGKGEGGKGHMVHEGVVVVLSHKCLAQYTQNTSLIRGRRHKGLGRMSLLLPTRSLPPPHR